MALFFSREGVEFIYLDHLARLKVVNLGGNLLLILLTPIGNAGVADPDDASGGTLPDSFAEATKNEPDSLRRVADAVRHRGKGAATRTAVPPLGGTAIQPGLVGLGPRLALRTGFFVRGVVHVDILPYTDWLLPVPFRPYLYFRPYMIIPAQRCIFTYHVRLL